jgi:hypothetical protein
MEFLKNIDWKPATIAKVAGLAVLGVVILAFVISLLGSSVKTLQRGSTVGVTEMMQPASYDMGMPSLSIRNISPIVPPMPGGTSGADAEEYEVSDYTASIETRDLTEACVTVRKLKDLDYVIFETAHESDTTCTFGFKVAHARVDEVLSYIKTLDPKDLSESTYTIKNQVEDFTSEIDILKGKLASIDKTFTSALTAYDDITELATRTGNAEALAQVVSSKVAIIERLTAERLNVSAQLDRLAREKARQLDRLVYSRFYVSVYENKYLDGEALADSWKASVQKFVADVNEALQNATVNLVGFLVALVPYILYLVILIVAAKYGWRVAQYIWRR